jgi:hypothetical protein
VADRRMAGRERDQRRLDLGHVHVRHG